MIAPAMPGMVSSHQVSRSYGFQPDHRNTSTTPMSKVMCDRGIFDSELCTRKFVIQSGAAAPHSRTCPTGQAHLALAFWSAAVLRRFGFVVFVLLMLQPP